MTAPARKASAAWSITSATRFDVLDHGYVVSLERADATVEAIVQVYWRRDSGCNECVLHVDGLRTDVAGDKRRWLLADAAAWVERNANDVADATVGAR